MGFHWCKVVCQRAYDRQQGEVEKGVSRHGLSGQFRQKFRRRGPVGRRCCAGLAQGVEPLTVDDPAVGPVRFVQGAPEQGAKGVGQQHNLPYRLPGGLGFGGQAVLGLGRMPGIERYAQRRIHKNPGQGQTHEAPLGPPAQHGPEQGQGQQKIDDVHGVKPHPFVGKGQIYHGAVGGDDIQPDVQQHHADHEQPDLQEAPVSRRGGFPQGARQQRQQQAQQRGRRQ